MPLCWALPLWLGIYNRELLNLILFWKGNPCGSLFYLHIYCIFILFVFFSLIFMQFFRRKA